LKFLGVTILQGVEFPIFLLISEWALQQCSATALPVIQSTAYRPQTQGSVERWHQVLHSMLAKVIAEHQRDWSRYLAYVTFCYNVTTHSATGFAPRFVMTGQRPRWNIDLLLCDKPYEKSTVSEFKATLLYRLKGWYPWSGDLGLGLRRGPVEETGRPPPTQRLRPTCVPAGGGRTSR